MKHFLLIISVLIISVNRIGLSQQSRVRPWQSPFQMRKVAPAECLPEYLLIYQDCRMCACPRPNRVAKCFRKSCDLRTKDTGQCPATVLKMSDGKNCKLSRPPGLACKMDSDCPNTQLCCFDFCYGTKCADPIALDDLTGKPHRGIGYQ